MADRDVGAGGLAPGSVSGAGLAPGALGAGSIMGTAGEFDAALAAALADAPLVDVANPDVARWLQTILRDAGYYLGPIDGIWGSKSEAANAAWNADGQPGQKPAPAGPAIAAAPAGGGGVSVAPARVAAGERTATGERTTPKPLAGDWKQQARDQFPMLAGLLEIPEVEGIAKEALQFEWPAEKIVARLQNSQWHKTTPAAMRQWIGLKGSDPATADRLLGEKRAAVLQATKDYYVDLSEPVAGSYAEQLLTGQIDEAGFQKELIDLAKSKYPALAAALDAGRTVRQAADPYVQLAVKELEIPDGTVDLNDPKWARPLQQIDPKTGAPLMMTLYDWQRTIRTDETYGWDRTSGARQMAAQFVTQLGQTFGRVA
jgi:hypothetical protein